MKNTRTIEPLFEKKYCNFNEEQRNNWTIVKRKINVILMKNRRTIEPLIEIKPT